MPAVAPSTPCVWRRGSRPCQTADGVAVLPGQQGQGTLDSRCPPPSLSTSRPQDSNGTHDLVQGCVSTISVGFTARGQTSGHGLPHFANQTAPTKTAGALSLSSHQRWVSRLFSECFRPRATQPGHLVNQTQQRFTEDVSQN